MSLHDKKYLLLYFNLDSTVLVQAQDISQQTLGFVFRYLRGE